MWKTPQEVTDAVNGHEDTWGTNGDNSGERKISQ
jgi:hypothetical protein